MSLKGTTIEKHLIEAQRATKARGYFSGLLAQITLAGKIISSEVNKAGLAGILGLTGKKNVQGEEVQKLDEFANQTFIKCLEHSGYLCAMASEEEEGIINIPDKYSVGEYVLLFDPLDGSSNIDANVSIGSIFSIYNRVSNDGSGTFQDLLQKGSKQVCAGYILYGASTLLVYTTGEEVNIFTLDPSVGEFLLSHENIKIPTKGRIYSCNEGYYKYWDENVKNYINYLKDLDSATNRPYSLRYIGSLVADFHRTLLYGGIFLYPADKKDPTKPSGKLRLLYEASPLAFIAETAGGLATTGSIRILNIKPENLHQRVPLIMGSKSDVELAEKIIQGKN